MNVHIAPIGTQSDEHIRRAVHGKTPVDKLYLIPTKESYEKAIKLKEDLENTLSSLKIEIKMLEEQGRKRFIDPFNLNDIVAAILQIANAEKGNKLFVNITGGTNLMAGGATTAAYLTGATIYYIKKQQENERLEDIIIKIPVPKIPLYKYGEIRVKILKIIAEKGGRINKAKELARELDIAPQTVSYHLKELEKSGLVKVIMDENNRRQKQYEITENGKLIATLFEVD
jgi:CRISPR locus-related DNA-binding protein